ncbi:hypothetical protein Cs7R123_51190 [Catellatospora sp. TT07R-123]|uniref:hypothetical protein n=1 Tax=Catellatospora sp. TT07R-123 TaxID=2733863 RepID=UPI001B020588|nr:hypothetical protein [Catellatospora sp. TT07R-123]GHJ47777.1 hypothetical protein Cs7R123_51190 [Catellatospora sp. TT07R-123]
MSFFNAAGRNERKLQRLQDQANDHATRAMALLRAGRPLEAIRPSQQAIETILHLRQLEPDNQEHLAQLAGKLYNHAAMLDHAGRGAEAVAVARRALESYLELSGGEVDPQAAALDRVIPRGAFSAGSAVPDLAAAAAMTADARSRLALMLAKWGGPAVAAEARQLAVAAVDTYQQLKEIGAADSEDFLRVVTRYDQVCRLLEAQE